MGSVKLLLEHADKAEAPDLPDPRRLVNASNLTGLSPCHFAAWRGHGSALRELVNAGAALAVSRARGCARRPGVRFCAALLWVMQAPSQACLIRKLFGAAGS